MRVGCCGNLFVVEDRAILHCVGTREILENLGVVKVSSAVLGNALNESFKLRNRCQNVDQHSSAHSGGFNCFADAALFRFGAQPAGVFSKSFGERLDRDPRRKRSLLEIVELVNFPNDSLVVVFFTQSKYRQLVISRVLLDHALGRDAEMEVELGKALGGVLVPGPLVLGPALANLDDGVVVVDGIVVLLKLSIVGSSDGQRLLING